MPARGTALRKHSINATYLLALNDGNAPCVKMLSGDGIVMKCFLVARKVFSDIKIVSPSAIQSNQTSLVGSVQAFPLTLEPQAAGCT